MLLRFWNDRSGATVIEYGVLLTVLSLVIVAAVANVADKIEFLFSDPASKLQQGLD
jgi:pilus assembly protein Flp/PilA